MLYSCSSLGVQVLIPTIESGVHALRHTSFLSARNKKNDSKVTEVKTEKDAETKSVKVPFLPSYLDRLMPAASFLSNIYVAEVNDPKIRNRGFLQPFLMCYNPAFHQAIRHFKVERADKPFNTKTDTFTRSQKHSNKEVENVLKSLENILKNSNKGNAGKEAGLFNFRDFSFKDFLKYFVNITLIVIICSLLWKRTNIFGSKKFRSLEEKGVISNVKFSDVCGIDEVKDEMNDIIEYLKDPEKFTSVGAKLPKGILLVGPPGTGKTLLAKAVAGEAGVPFFYAAGSEFDEMFVGVGAMRIRELFNKAKSQAPAIIFIDEIDACGSKRVNSSLQPYARHTINQLLQEMDGFHGREGIIVIGATNTGEVLDKALTRPGRFDQKVTFLLPDVKGRKETLHHYINKLENPPDSSAINLDRIASLSGGMSGADLSNLINQAALHATKYNHHQVTQDDLEYALDKARMGPELKTRVKTESELRATAFHEAGHALVAFYTPAAMQIYKATINQRGGALGHVSLIPSREMENTHSKEQILAQIDVGMGGRVAEELINGTEKVSTGAASDIETSTQLAYQFVCRFGMSEKLGLMTYDLEHLSQETKRHVEMEVKSILEKSYEKAKKLLTVRHREHKILAEALLRFETLTMDEIKVLFQTKDLESVQKSRQNEEKAKLTKQLEKLSITAPVIDYVPSSTEAS